MQQKKCQLNQNFQGNGTGFAIALQRLINYPGKGSVPWKLVRHKKIGKQLIKKLVNN